MYLAFQIALGIILVPIILIGLYWAFRISIFILNVIFGVIFAYLLPFFVLLFPTMLLFIFDSWTLKVAGQWILIIIGFPIIMILLYVLYEITPILPVLLGIMAISLYFRTKQKKKLNSKNRSEIS